MDLDASHPQVGVPQAAKAEPRWSRRLRRAGRLDLTPLTPRPSALRWALAVAVALGGALAVDTLIVRLTTSQFPTTRGFPHFQFADYTALTLIGVVLASLAWPAVTQVSSSARWLFLRLTVVVTLLLWVPDLWLYLAGQNPRAVTALVVMHLAITLVTYNALVHLAPAGRRGEGRASRPDASRAAVQPQLPERLVRRIWSTMAALAALEAALGIAVIVSVPFHRPNAVLPVRGAVWLYEAHGAIGVALALGAIGALALSHVAGRMGRIGAVMGAAGVSLGVVGGTLSSFQQSRLLGMALMLLGVVVAAVGYMAPSLEALGRAEIARAELARAEAARARPKRTGLGSAAGAVAVEGSSANGHSGANGRGAPPVVP